MRTCSAILFDDAEAGPQLSLVDVRDPRGDEVLVRMEASGLCHSDYHVVKGEWPFDYRIVLGHEGAGIVEAVGERVSDLQIGQRVIVNWYASCGQCRACAEARPYLCSSTKANENLLPDGSTPVTHADGLEVRPILGVGTHAEYAVLTRRAVVPVSDRVPAGVAAIIGCAVTTGVGAVLNTANVRPGQSAVVVGTGGVGQSIVLALAMAGASPIIAVDLSEERREAARELGATHALAGDDPDLQQKIAEISGEGGADFAFDAIGHPSVTERLPEYVRNGGAVVLVGMPAREATVAFKTWYLVATNKRILGSNYGSSNPSVDFPAIADLYLAGRLPLDKLLGDAIPLGEYPERMAAFGASTGLKQVVDYTLR